MKCVIYARFSPRPDEATSDSNDKQVESCREYASEQGWEVAGVFEDRGKSRDDPDREGMADAIYALGRGDVLLCYDSSRFGGGAAAVFYEDRLNRKGARLAFVVGGSLEDSLEAKLIREIMYAFNGYQRAMIAARTRAKMRKQQAQGMIRSKILPYGFVRDPQNEGMMIRCDKEWPVVQMIFYLREQGMGHKRIASFLTEWGVAPRAKRWHKSTIKNILEREYMEPVVPCMIQA